MSQKPKVLIIVGPTGSGKTALSLKLATLYGGEVISSDSRQVYRGLDIGTEKITPLEMGNIIHHEIDIVPIETVYTAQDFVNHAEQAIQRITAQGKLPIIAGGTYFYIQTLLRRVTTPAVPPNPKLRKTLSTLTLPELQAQLHAIDPARLQQLDQANPRRLIRAIEVASVLGHVPITSVTDCPFDPLLLGIKTAKDSLRTRLHERAKAALERGLIEETKDLLANGITRERLSEIGLQYPLVIAYLDGLLTKAELEQKLTEKNWQYAKRQMTWLKRDTSIIWIDPTDFESTTQIVDNYLSS
jgi:tRNA dimethylallyltransferase